MAPLQLRTSDGQRLAADVAAAPGEARGAVVICHPHPQYGGDRFNPVVAGLFGALPHAGFTAIRFDFRAAHDGGVADRLDVVAALEHVAIPGLSTFVVGYSFGALVALSTTDERIAGIVAIAPPLRAGAAPPSAPTLVVTPRHDQFCPPDVASDIVAGWPRTEFDVVETADHFLVGHSALVAERATTWLTAR